MPLPSRLLPLRPATLLLGLLMGSLGALAAALLRLGFRSLQWLLTHQAETPGLAAAALPPWARLLVPVAGAGAATLVLWLRRESAVRPGDTPEPSVDYVEATRLRHGAVPLGPDLWRTGSASFSVSSGASVGREGSMIQFAASITSNALRLARRATERHRPRLFGLLRQTDPALALACGVAGGVTTAYAAPVAAVFFAAEIALGEWTLAELAPLALAAASGHFIAGWLLGPGPLYPIDAAAHTLTHLGLRQIICMLLGAGIFGLIGPAYQRVIRGLRGARALPLPLLWSGLMVGLLSLADPRVWGNGETALKAALGSGAAHGLPAGAGALLLLLCMRLAATAFLRRHRHGGRRVYTDAVHRRHAGCAGGSAAAPRGLAAAGRPDAMGRAGHELPDYGRDPRATDGHLHGRGAHRRLAPAAGPAVCEHRRVDRFPPDFAGSSIRYRLAEPRAPGPAGAQCAAVTGRGAWYTYG